MKKLTLTFDNGPDPICTPIVLDILKERGIEATFFVCGRGNRLHPALPAHRAESRRILERARAEGHWIGNHTLTHTIELGTTTDPEVIEREIGQSQMLLGELNDRRAPTWAEGSCADGPSALRRSAISATRATAS